jgi:hypothetical protein
MKTDTVSNSPIPPDTHVLPQSTVSRARNVGKDSIEQHWLEFLFEIGFGELRNLAFVVVGELESV